jgi:hypothetical protein
MALFNCPECKREISSTADSCPHCGHKNKKITSKQATEEAVKQLALVVIFSVLAIVAGAAIQMPIFSYAGFALLLCAVAAAIGKILISQ